MISIWERASPELVPSLFFHTNTRRSSNGGGSVSLCRSHGALDVRRREGRFLRAESAAGAGDRILPRRVSDAAPTALGHGAARARAG